MVGKEIPCAHPDCQVTGQLFFLSQRIKRYFSDFGPSGEIVTEQIDIPLCLCKGCHGRFRVLPVEVTPYKIYGFAAIERLCWSYLIESVGLRKIVQGPGLPHYTTLHGWLGGLGERSLDRLILKQKGKDPAGSSIIKTLLPTSALIAESSKRLDPKLEVFWHQPLDPLAPFKYHSEARWDQLQGSLRLLNASFFLFPQASSGLADWEGFLRSTFHVTGWWFPSRIQRTGIQLSSVEKNFVGSSINKFSPLKGVINEHGPPSSGLLAF